MAIETMKVNSSRGNLLIKGIVEEAKKRFSVEFQKEVDEFVKRMEDKKIIILQGIVMEVEDHLKVDSVNNEILFIVRENNG